MAAAMRTCMLGTGRQKVERHRPLFTGSPQPNPPKRSSAACASAQEPLLP